jgi:hypothetical protein
MKKLALALVCLVSVAFFASCDPEITNPEPTIALITGENYVYDGQTIDVNTDYLFGVRAASNSQTGKELASFKLDLKILDMEDNVEYTQDTTYAISGTEYVYQDTLGFTYTRELVGKVEITATAIDADGKSCHVTIKLNVNQPAQNLEVKDITWTRKGSNLQGNTQAEMAAAGLQWIARDAFHANIRPLSNCTLYVIENDLSSFENVVTNLDKAACFANLQETGRPVDEYRNVSVAVTGDKTYNDILAVVDAQGNTHLVLIGVANVQTGSFGVQTTITGKVK